MSKKPSIPKGTRDFSPLEIAKRQYIIQIIKTHFEKFGFQPIETPSFENSETLMGKYGEEGDRLIFKILNSGDYLENVPHLLLEQKESHKMTPFISEKALRYDLTVPFARYVVQHQNDIEFPFKRYQIQPVWRADRPQKGRFREFYQCDADVVGSNSLWQEVELIQLYDAVFTDLGIQGITIKINHRKILSGIAEIIGAQEQLIAFTTALDKLDKIGIENVKKEMTARGISEQAIAKIEPLFDLTGTISEKLNQLKILLSASKEGSKGIAELEFIYKNISALGLDHSLLDLDITLARGLNYYTGTIIEVTPPKNVSLGSIGGGGRYDDLTGIFGLKNMSGVGISFGLDRIFLVMEELHLFPQTITETTKAIFLNFGDQEALYSMKAITKLRKQGIKVALYPDAAKINKQFQYADKKNIPFAILVGEEEVREHQYKIKNVVSGEQKILSFDELISFLK